jgi:hypothetical protein
MSKISKETSQILDKRVVAKLESKFLVLYAVAAFVALLCPALASASILGTAESFAVLGASTVTNTGSTIITGNVGVWAGSAVTGFLPTNTFVGPGSHTDGPGSASGTIHLMDAVAQQAQVDVTTAYNGLASMPVTSNLSGQDLGGLTLTSGVYHFNSSAQLTGTLTLDAQGNNNAYWVFQIGSTLTTASSSVVQLINLGSNDGRDDGLFWQVGSSATLGTTTAFEGNILALANIALNTDATILNGRALAQVEAVNMDANIISIVCPNGGPGYSGGLMYDSAGNIVPIPLPPTLLLLGSGLVGLGAFRIRIGKGAKKA